MKNSLQDPPLLHIKTFNLFQRLNATQHSFVLNYRMFITIKYISSPPYDWPLGFVVEQCIYDPYPINVNVDHRQDQLPTSPSNMKKFQKKLEKQLNKSAPNWLQEICSTHVVSKSFVLDLQVNGSYADGATIQEYEDILCSALCDAENILRKIPRVAEMANFGAQYVWREGTLKNQLLTILPNELNKDKTQPVCQIAELIINGFKIGCNVSVQYEEKQMLLNLKDYVVVLEPWSKSVVSVPKTVVLITRYPKTVYLGSYNKEGPYMTTLKNANVYNVFQDEDPFYQIAMELPVPKQVRTFVFAPSVLYSANGKPSLTLM